MSDEVKPMTLLRCAVMLPALLFLTACSDTYDWHLRRQPMTPEESVAAAQHVQAVLGNVPESLSGFDQDWDDAIAAAHREAKELFCRPTLWEWRSAGFPRTDSSYTGRWRYFDEKPTAGDR